MSVRACQLAVIGEESTQVLDRDDWRRSERQGGRTAGEERQDQRSWVHARERSRTSTGLPPPAPKAGASAVSPPELGLLHPPAQRGNRESKGAQVIGLELLHLLQKCINVLDIAEPLCAL